MSSISDEFQFLLQSNLKGISINKPSLYKTELAKPLDLPGEWYVALIDILYPHIWKKLDKSYPYLILKIKNDDETFNFEPDDKKDQRNLYDVMNILNQRGAFLETSEMIRGSDIPLGNYEISKILELRETQFNMGLRIKLLILKIIHTNIV